MARKRKGGSNSERKRIKKARKTRNGKNGKKERAEVPARTDERVSRFQKGKGHCEATKTSISKVHRRGRHRKLLDLFERVATLHKWPKTIWATQLTGVLSGKALKAFSSLPTEKCTKYDEVKHAILQRYNVNSETYRLRFRNDSYKPGQSHHEYFNRLEEHFQRWTKSQEMELRDLIILEQFLQGVSTDLSVWLKKRKPKSAKEAAQMADDYVLARGTKPSYEKLSRPQRLQGEPAVKVIQEK